MGYKAKDAIQPLDYDFRPFAEIHGCTEEPSGDQVTDFQERQRAAFVKLGIDPNDDDNAEKTMLDLMASLDKKQLEEIADEQIDAFAALCGAEQDAEGNWSGGNPSRDQIASLPFRIRQSWFGYIAQEIFNPESQAVVTKLSPVGSSGGKRTTGRNAS